MEEKRVSIWAKIWNLLGFYWKEIRSPSDIIKFDRIQLLTLPEPLKENVRKISSGHKEMVARVQQMVGVSPTEGHELVHGLHLTKCRSSGMGVSRPSTNIARSQMDQAQKLLGVGSEIADENQSVEEIRSLTRTAIRDIMAHK